jgi:glycosyltransferase involved in cell wall biosynthesis
MQTNNKFAIIMTVKNETKFLINVLRLLCAQKPDQLILVDGNSEDDYINLFKTLQDRWKFEYILNDVPPGSLRDSPFGAFLRGHPTCKA